MAIPYVGGKFRLADWVIQHFPLDYKRKLYVEVFGGAAWVLLHKEPSKGEVYNDMNADLVNLFTILRNNFEAFRERAEWVLQGRAVFEDAFRKLEAGDFKDDIEHA